MPNLNSEGDATDSGRAILAAPGVGPNMPDYNSSGSVKYTDEI